MSPAVAKSILFWVLTIVFALAIYMLSERFPL